MSGQFVEKIIADEQRDYFEEQTALEVGRSGSFHAKYLVENDPCAAPGNSFEQIIKESARFHWLICIYPVMLFHPFKAHSTALSA